MSIISVSNLTKEFQIFKKEPGMKGTLQSLINRKYETKTAVDGVSFTIEEGELVGFIGPNGAGKTTTLKMLSGLLYPTSGNVSVLGFTPFDRQKAFLKQIALVMGQKNQLWWDLPAIDTFLLNKEIYEISNTQYKQVLGQLVELLDVEDILHVQVRKLSLGQRMKMELIAALLHTPKVLFLDEPTIGLDVVMQAKMREFVRSYNEQFSSTIILTSHYMDDVKELCKRVIVIDKGTILFDGPLESIIKKYAKQKYISIQLSEEIDQKKISKISPISSYEYPKVVFQVDRSDATKVAGKLLDTLPVADLTIEEPKIEDIIREVFGNERIS